MKENAQNWILPARWSTPSARAWFAVVLTALLALLPAQAQECASGSEIDPAILSALGRTAATYYQMAVSGDFAGLKQSSLPSVASDFSGIEQAVGENRDNFQGSQATLRVAYALSAPGTATIARAEFFCGIFNAPDHVTFIIPNLPPGHYAVVVEDVSGGKQPIVLTLILNQQGSAWKLAGLAIKPRQVAGHDSAWFAAQAGQYRAKGDDFTAWLYYVEAWELAEPANFMYTPSRDRLVDALTPVRPPDPPSKEHPMLLISGADTYRVTDIFPDAVGSDLVLVVKYQALSDISNTVQTTGFNSRVIKAVVGKYPGLRDGFSSVVARAVDASGHDYGTLLPLKEVK